MKVTVHLTSQQLVQNGLMQYDSMYCLPLAHTAVLDFTADSVTNLRMKNNIMCCPRWPLAPHTLQGSHSKLIVSNSSPGLRQAKATAHSHSRRARYAELYSASITPTVSACCQSP